MASKKAMELRAMKSRATRSWITVSDGVGRTATRNPQFAPGASINSHRRNAEGRLIGGQRYGRQWQHVGGEPYTFSTYTTRGVA